MGAHKLIPVVSGTLGGQRARLVDAPLLHAFLEVGRDFSNLGRLQPEVKDLEEVERTGWAAWLAEEQRHLVWMRAEKRGWRDISRRFGCDRTTAWRRWQKALGVVARRLNVPGLQRKAE